MVAPEKKIEQALNLLQRAEQPLVLVGKGMAWADAEGEVRSFIEKTQVPFLRSPMGKGVMPDDHPLSVAAARTLALQNADVVFLMGARFNWIFHPGFRRDRLRPRPALRQGHEGHSARHRARGDRRPRWALIDDGKAIVEQLNAALAGRQWFHPKDTPRRQMITKKAQEKRQDDPAADPRRRVAGQLLPRTS
jgi:2-hydroxyacyl-CoA lyase 1